MSINNHYFYKNILITLFSVLVSFFVNYSTACSQSHSLDNSEQIDYALVFDVSGSMNRPLEEEQPLTKLDHVKKVAAEFALQLDVNLGVRVWVYTFDAGLQTTKLFDIISIQVRSQLVAYINNLEAHGNNTFIYRSLDNICKAHVNVPHPLLILLYSDGADNSGDPLDFVINSLNELKKERYSLVYSTFLGFQGISQEDQGKIRRDFERLSREAGVKYGTTDETPQPIRILRLRQPWLDFGVYQTDSPPSRVVHLYSDNISKFPEGFSVLIRIEFPSLGNGMVVPSITPALLSLEMLTPDDNGSFVAQSLELKADNIEYSDLDGQYEGKIQLIPSDQSIVIIPDKIHVVFRYGPERKINVKFTDGYKFDAGSLNAFETGSAVSKKYKIEFDYNEAARVDNKKIKLEVIPIEDIDKDAYKNVTVQINSEPRSQFTITPEHSKAEISISVSNLAKDGEIGFVVRLTGDDVQLFDATADSTVSSVLKAEINFEIEEEPPPPWLFWFTLVGGGLLLIILILIVFSVLRGEGPFDLLDMVLSVFCATKFPVATLSLRKTLSDGESDFQLLGLKEIIVGSGGKFASGADTGSLKLTPRKQGKKFKVDAVVLSGDVLLREQGEKTAFPITNSIIADGDQIVIGEYIIEFTSIKIVR